MLRSDVVGELVRHCYCSSPTDDRRTTEEIILGGLGEYEEDDAITSGSDSPVPVSGAPLHET